MKKTPLIGRIEEQKILQSALLSPKPEMVAVMGRRRVGKTFLVRSVYREQIDFEISGVQNATRHEQLRNFMIQIAKFSQGKFPFTEPSKFVNQFFSLFPFWGKSLQFKKAKKK